MRLLIRDAVFCRGGGWLPPSPREGGEKPGHRARSSPAQAIAAVTLYRSRAYPQQAPGQGGKQEIES